MYFVFSFCQDILHFSTIYVKYKVQFKFQLFNLLSWFLFYRLFIILLFEPSTCFHFSRYILQLHIWNYLFKVSIFQRVCPYCYCLFSTPLFFKIQIIYLFYIVSIQLHIQSPSYPLFFLFYSPSIIFYPSIFSIFQDTCTFQLHS